MIQIKRGLTCLPRVLSSLLWVFSLTTQAQAQRNKTDVIPPSDMKAKREELLEAYRQVESGDPNLLNEVRKVPVDDAKRRIDAQAAREDRYQQAKVGYLRAMK